MPEPEQPEKPSPNAVSQGVLELVDAGVAGNLGTRTELLFHYINLQRLMADRLLNEGKSVDLGFITLHCSPYRANWKQIVWRRNLIMKQGLVGHFRRHSNQGKVNPESYREYPATRGDRTRLLKLSLLAMNTDEGYVYRRVEVEHTRSWWRMVKRVEGQRLLRLGELKYAKYIIEAAVAAIETTLRLYLQWATAASRWNAVSFERDGESDYRLVQEKPSGCAPRDQALPPFSRDQLVRIRGTGEPEGLPPEAPVMPEVPADGQKVEDVRDSGVELGNMVKPTDG